MNTHHIIKKIKTGILASAIIMFSGITLSGCGTKYISEGITDAGQVKVANVVFPDLNDAWQKDGQFPNNENLAKIKSGISKDELYHLLGRPHFSEAQYAREWDYILKFYDADNSVKICQYKVIFDNEFKGQQFYWKPSDCPPQIKEPTTIVMPASAPVQIEAVPATQRINLGADALFKFNKWKTEDILIQGRQELNELAVQLRGYQHSADINIVITGHTDLLGDDMYNMSLSQLRAQTVRQYLSSQGVQADSMIATGAGESEPVKQCATTLSRPQLILCLQPNRRVTLDVSVVK